MFNKILCATDLNKENDPVITKAVQVAHQFNSSIIILNVHDEFMDKEEMEMLRVNVESVQSEFEKTAILAKNEMKGIIHSLHAEDIKVEFILKKGKPNKIICDESDKLGADLIIIGKSSSSNISNIILGSTAAYIVNHANVPVLVVP
ncbi:MAG: universal stress protein [Candidatus Marinimicrobia bacterium]|jgi:nucleotide-binding universal stress UspA family protein|nr:universal stress protein [Candidatus Neomarinimicrobiota bacterium]